MSPFFIVSEERLLESVAHKPIISNQHLTLFRSVTPTADHVLKGKERFIRKWLGKNIIQLLVSWCVCYFHSSRFYIGSEVVIF